MLTEPVTCASCAAVSVNGGTLHCHRCYSVMQAALRLIVEKIDASECRVPLDVHRSGGCSCELDDSIAAIDRPFTIPTKE